MYFVLFFISYFNTSGFICTMETVKPLQDADDLFLWQRLIKGDRKAMEELYEKYYSLLMNYGLRCCDDREQVKDAIQDLFVRIFANGRVRSDVTVRSYLLCSLKNILFNYATKWKDMEDIETCTFRIPQDEELFECLFPKDDAEQDMARRLLHALSQLSVRQKHALYLRYVSELSHREIADILKMNEQSSMNLLNRTLAKLRTFVMPKEDLMWVGVFLKVLAS